MVRSRGFSLGNVRPDSVLFAERRFVDDKPETADARSLSGGGVGGNMSRFGGGGSDCWRYLDLMSVFTRLFAANERDSGALSSFEAFTLFMRLISAPVKPVKALALSTAATSFALPR